MSAYVTSTSPCTRQHTHIEYNDNVFIKREEEEREEEVEAVKQIRSHLRLLGEILFRNAAKKSRLKKHVQQIMIFMYKVFASCNLTKHKTTIYQTNDNRQTKQANNETHT